MYLVLNSSTLIIVVLLAIACLYFIDCLSDFTSNQHINRFRPSTFNNTTMIFNKTNQLFIFSTGKQNFMFANLPVLVLVLAFFCFSAAAVAETAFFFTSQYTANSLSCKYFVNTSIFL